MATASGWRGSWMLVAALAMVDPWFALADAPPAPAYQATAKTPAMKRVEDYVFSPDPYRSGIAPRRLAAADVGAYLAIALARNPKLSVQSARAAATVARFYATHEVVAPLRTLLDNQETTSDDLQRSIAFTLMLIVGGPADVTAATDYFAHLCSKAATVHELGQLIELFVALGTAADPAPLAAAMQRQLTILAPTRKTSYTDRIAAAEIEGTLTRELQRADRARTRKAELLAVADRNARLAALVRLYLDLDATEGYLEYLQPWAAERLVRETWASRPAEFTTRVDAPKYRAGVVTALRKALPAIAKRPADERDSLRLRALRAIKFFRGKLTAAEVKFLATHAATQVDALADEGFMIQAS